MSERQQRVRQIPIGRGVRGSGLCCHSSVGGGEGPHKSVRDSTTQGGIYEE